MSLPLTEVLQYSALNAVMLLKYATDKCLISIRDCYMYKYFGFILAVELENWSKHIDMFTLPFLVQFRIAGNYFVICAIL